MKSGIYLILNSITNKFYIGSAVDTDRRCREHRSRLFNGNHVNVKLQRAYNKYGIEAFGFAVLEEWPIETLLEREQFWLDYTKCYDTGYNINKIAEGTYGYKHTEEAKRKMSELKKGLVHSEETKLKMSKSASGKSKNFNRKLSKWPHDLGYNCKCEECVKAKNKYMQEWKKRKGT